MSGIFFTLFCMMILVLCQRGKEGRVQRRMLIPVGALIFLLATTVPVPSTSNPTPLTFLLCSTSSLILCVRCKRSYSRCKVSQAVLINIIQTSAIPSTSPKRVVMSHRHYWETWSSCVLLHPAKRTKCSRTFRTGLATIRSV